LLLDSEDIDIRRARLRLAEKCFDLEATAASPDDLPQLRSYLKVVGDDAQLTQDEKMQRVDAVLFGWERESQGRDGRDDSKT